MIKQYFGGKFLRFKKTKSHPKYIQIESLRHLTLYCCEDWKFSIEMFDSNLLEKINQKKIEQSFLNYKIRFDW